MKLKLFYVYAYVGGRRVYKGRVKVKSAKKAMEIAHEEYGDLPLDVIRACYVVDRKLGTMRGPQKKQ